MSRPDIATIRQACRERWKTHEAVLSLQVMCDYVEELEKALAVVRENYDKCRLIDRDEAEERCDEGHGYIGIPHEECIAAIRAVLPKEPTDGA